MVIRYRINPTPPPATSLTREQIVQAITSAARRWEAANPKVHLVYDGTTDQRPHGGLNIVGFDASYTSGVTTYPLTGQYATSFDMVFSTTQGWGWKPCNPPDSPCSDYDSDRSFDLENVATHEWGHVLGLAHVKDQELSMSNERPLQGGVAARNAVTLGLGDVLGVRKLYPTDAAMPTLYSP